MALTSLVVICRAACNSMSAFPSYLGIGTLRLIGRGFTQYANIANGRLRGQPENSLASILQTLSSVTLFQLHKACAGFEALFGFFAVIQKTLHGFSGANPDSVCPCREFISVVAEISSVRFRHMLRLHHGITLCLFKTNMSRDLCLLVKHLHNVFGKADIDLFTDQIKGNGVFVDAVAHQIVIADLWMKPNGRLVCI